MKTLIKLFAILILILLLYPKVKKRFESKDYQIIAYVYSNENSSNLLTRYLRIIPDKDRYKYKLTQISDSSDYQIYRIDNMNYGVPNYSYLIYYKNKQKIVDLKSERLVEYAVDKELVNVNEVEKYYDLVVNKVEFNKIYKSLSTYQKQIAFANLFRTSLDTTTYRLIETKTDIDNVLKWRPKEIEYIIDTNGINEYDTSLNDFSFLENNEKFNNVLFYWYFDSGLIKFIFKFNETEELVSVEYEDLGYLGNEILYL